LFSKSYSDIIIVIGELNWKDVVNNPINDLSDDDEDYVCSYDSSFPDNDNNDYDENVDIDTLFEKQKNYLMSMGLTFHDTSSDDSKLSEKNQSANVTSGKQSLSKNIIIFKFVFFH